MTATSPDDALLQQAEAVLARLGALVSRFAVLPGDHRHAHHHGFAALYLSTTRAWLANLAQHPDRAFAYALMPAFFALYQQHVIDCLDVPITQIVPHWRTYHRQARRMTEGANPVSRFILVLRAIYAHTHHDLGVALRQTEAHQGVSFGARSLPPRRVMFDPAATQAFAEGATAFFAIPTEDGAPLPPFRQVALRVLPATYRLWVPMLHASRLTGYHRARLLGPQ